MTVIINSERRAAILGYASALLPSDDRSNPVTVAAAAIPLLEWAEQSADDDDLRNRMRAMGRQYANQHEPSAPERFVEDAGTLYAFITAGGR